MAEIMLYKTYTTEDDKKIVNEVIDRGTWWVKGKEIRQLQQKIADYVGVENAVAFNCGTSALYTMLKSIGKDGEVILPAFTFVATANAVVNAGFHPVFVDIEKDTYGISARNIKEKITNKTKAILPVHYMGRICRDMEKILTIGRKNGIPVIEDAAHALGSYNALGWAGTLGEGGMYSMSFNKIISTGEGGIAVTNNKKIVDYIGAFSDQGKKDGDVIMPGLNLRMSSINAALGISQMSNIEQMIRMRNNIADVYQKEIGDIVRCPRIGKKERCVFQRYAIMLDNKEEKVKMQRHLKENNIPCSDVYKPIYHYKYYSQIKKTPLNNTEDVYERMLLLPMYPHLNVADVEDICRHIREGAA